jgi:flagellar protein FlbD
MIRLTRLNGQQITVNSDLIKLVESNPDTVITLIGGDKVLVHERPEEVIERVIEFRRAVLANLLAIHNDTGTAVTAMSSAHWDRNSTLPTEEKPRG